MSFSKVEDSLSDVIADPNSRMKAAYKSLTVQGLTKDVLINSAQQYVMLLEQDRDGFQKALTDKLQAEVGGRQKKLEDMKKSIADNQEQIELLTKSIAQTQNDMIALQSEIGEAETKIKRNEGTYVAACEAIINKIKSDITKATNL